MRAQGPGVRLPPVLLLRCCFYHKRPVFFFGSTRLQLVKGKGRQESTPFLEHPVLVGQATGFRAQQLLAAVCVFVLPTLGFQLA